MSQVDNHKTGQKGIHSLRKLQLEFCQSQETGVLISSCADE